MKRALLAAFIAAGFTAASPAPRAVQAADQTYGSGLMTDQETRDYRQRMRGAKTIQEKKQIDSERRATIQERARIQGVDPQTGAPLTGTGGVTMPRNAPDIGEGQGVGVGPGMGEDQGMGEGMGPGMGEGMGPGMGEGQGMGPGNKMGPGK